MEETDVIYYDLKSFLFLSQIVIDTERCSMIEL